MKDPLPGTGTGDELGPKNKPIEFVDDGEFRHLDYWNSFQFDPPLTHDDCLKIASLARELGYQMLFRRADYSLEEVQEQLLDRGPGSFLNFTWLQEDISPKEPPKSAEQRMAERMSRLSPTEHLLITDPYLFTSGRKRDSQDYAASVVKMIRPALTASLNITAIVNPTQNDNEVRTAVLNELHAQGFHLDISVVESHDFHDRFWIADRARGFVSGSSLNKIGSRIFFVDELSESDVRDVVAEADAIIDQR
ncbi:hypothetical protein [Leucobacter chromiiresistens]|uniref:PLD-like domain-containing protein n=1 Tax=Leucobacter chromiiresistens TaxID=1079994 RepID=A0A147EP43_9MICO|nr:hypothetical protein [Leucobacter chromiiresistens]KTR86130.1 hypothetical protein NS354_06470 [Leucobacter chromiiresistens]